MRRRQSQAWRSRYVESLLRLEERPRPVVTAADAVERAARRNRTVPVRMPFRNWLLGTFDERPTWGQPTPSLLLLVVAGFGIAVSAWTTTEPGPLIAITYLFANATALVGAAVSLPPGRASAFYVAVATVITPLGLWYVIFSMPQQPTELNPSRRR